MKRTQVTLFENMSTPCLVAIIQRLVQVVALPDEYIFSQGEVGQEMVIVQTGAVKVTIQRGVVEFEVRVARQKRRATE